MLIVKIDLDLIKRILYQIFYLLVFLVFINIYDLAQ